VFNNNNFLTFDPLSDEALSIAMTDLKSGLTGVHVVSGHLTNFTAVSSGNFSADTFDYTCGPNGELCHVTNVPEPVTLSLFGAGLVGAAALRRRKTKAA
jgi:hypothetical protein